MADRCGHITQEEYARGLAYRLRGLRMESAMTQEAVAERAGIATYTYQKYEKGESRPGVPLNPRLFTLISLANVFDMDVRDLLTLEYDSRAGV
ncbi:helix-turn-helix domain-containing protein [uncultured Parolsenella sp.]|uniref:helix-turn-helix domain-containing protein n=1 Tax=uncultured Parolsenella sp. TaxID=2083008 RepID=UPI0027D974B9|nr:helix-turn-helix domain-containing protein [uncultured Parolsenella sp.]